MNNCTFCRLTRNMERMGVTNRRFWWKLDIHPVSPGHTLVIPIRHITSLGEMTKEEWAELQDSLREAQEFIERLSTGLRTVYKSVLQDRITENSVIFIKEMLAHPRLGQKPDGYNHGVNIGRAAGQTIDHLHWHVIPRYDGDMADPRGGVRHVIPRMGNYSTPRS